ncbi:MAG: primosomal protein N', partial [Bacteroidaceae bacterium]|nr:primosomal protein N' [Bacteroidaceae bacterium]
MSRYAHVILPLPLAESYTYTLPASFVSKVHVGCRLIVPFGSRKVYTGLVIGLSDEKPAGDFVLKEAMELLDEYPVVLPSQLRLWQWIADYYLCT